jgi:hypothetical protein
LANRAKLSGGTRAKMGSDGIEKDRSRRGVHNPAALLVDFFLVGLRQSLEHVHMPLPKLVDPLWDQTRTFRVTDHGVETTLEKWGSIKIKKRKVENDIP